MLKRIYITRLKCSIRDRQMIFWTMLFPVLLSILFGMAFSNLNAIDNFHAIPIAVVDNDAYKTDANLQGALASASGQSDSLFILQKLSAADAAAALKDKSIIGFLVPGETLEVVVAESGINQTVLGIFADEYLQLTATFKSIVMLNPAALQTLGDRIGQRIDLLQTQNPGAANPNNTLVYFYALIAMAALYGGFWGMKEVSAVQANQSPQAARLNLAPVHKLKVFGASLLAAFTVHFATILVLIAFLNVVIKVDFGNRIGYVLIACFAGSLLGIMLGALVGALVKGGEGIKVAILISVSMFCSFFAGMMNVEIKYIVSTNVPFMRYINPANLVADAFYSLYYYEGYSRFFLNIGLMAAMIVVFFLAVYFVLRRQRYASL